MRFTYQILNSDEANYSDNEERSHRRLRAEKDNSKTDYIKFKDDSKEEEDQNPPFMVSLCGLPYSSNENDVKEFLKGCEILNGLKGIELAVGANQRPNGIAFVELKSYEDLILAKERHKEHMGSRYIEVRRISEQDRRRMTERWKPRRDPVNAVVCLKGLPFNCTTDDIKEFFEGLEIENNGILIVLDERGRICGEGFVHFTSSRAVEVALRKHKQRIKHRYIEVYRSDLREMYPRSSLYSHQHPPIQQTIDPRNNFLSLLSERSFGTSFDGRYSRDESRFGPVRGRESDRYSRPYDRRSPPHSSRYSPRPYDGPSKSSRPRGPVQHFRSKTGHSIHMRGLPYSVHKDQIIDFFSPILPVDVNIEEHTNGMRTGNANVDFATDDDVKEAMRKDRERIDSRYIELYCNSGRR